MSKPDQIAHRAREMSMAKTSLLRVVVSDRVSSTKRETAAKSAPNTAASNKVD